MTEQPLPIKDIETLRAQGLLQEGETAVKVADKILAVNLVTQERRLLQTQNILLESTRRLLKD